MSYAQDKRGVHRGSCVCGQCAHYVPQTEGHACGYCGCLPVKHEHLGETDTGGHKSVSRLGMERTTSTEAAAAHWSQKKTNLTSDIIGFGTTVHDVRKPTFIRIPTCELLQSNHKPYYELPDKQQMKGVYKIAYRHKTVYVGKSLNIRRQLKRHMSGAQGQEIGSFVKNLPESDKKHLTVFWLDSEVHRHNCSGMSYLKCITRIQGEKPTCSYPTGYTDAGGGGEAEEVPTGVTCTPGGRSTFTTADRKSQEEKEFWGEVASHKRSESPPPHYTGISDGGEKKMKRSAYLSHPQNSFTGVGQERAKKNKDSGTLKEEVKIADINKLIKKESYFETDSEDSVSEVGVQEKYMGIASPAHRSHTGVDHGGRGETHKGSASQPQAHRSHTGVDYGGGGGRGRETHKGIASPPQAHRSHTGVDRGGRGETQSSASPPQAHTSHTGVDHGGGGGRGRETHKGIASPPQAHRSHTGVDHGGRGETHKRSASPPQAHRSHTGVIHGGRGEKHKSSASQPQAHRSHTGVDYGGGGGRGKEMHKGIASPPQAPRSHTRVDRGGRGETQSSASPPQAHTSHTGVDHRGREEKHKSSASPPQAHRSHTGVDHGGRGVTHKGIASLPQAHRSHTGVDRGGRGETHKGIASPPPTHRSPTGADYGGGGRGRETHKGTASPPQAHRSHTGVDRGGREETHKGIAFPPPTHRSQSGVDHGSGCEKYKGGASPPPSHTSHTGVDHGGREETHKGIASPPPTHRSPTGVDHGSGCEKYKGAASPPPSHTSHTGVDHGGREETHKGIASLPPTHRSPTGVYYGGGREKHRGIASPPPTHRSPTGVDHGSGCEKYKGGASPPPSHTSHTGVDHGGREETHKGIASLPPTHRSPTGVDYGGGGGRGREKHKGSASLPPANSRLAVVDHGRLKNESLEEIGKPTTRKDNIKQEKHFSDIHSICTDFVYSSCIKTEPLFVLHDTNVSHVNESTTVKPTEAYSEKQIPAQVESPVVDWFNPSEFQSEEIQFVPYRNEKQKEEITTMNSLFQGRETVVKEADRILQGKVTDIFKNNRRNSFIPKRRKSTANQKGHLKSHRQDICSVRTSERQTNQVKPTSVPNALSLNLTPKPLRSTTKDFLPSSSRKRASAQTTDISRILDSDIDILTGKHYEKQRSDREEWSVRKRSKLLVSSGSQHAPYLQETTGSKSSKVTVEKIETMALPKNTKYTDNAQSSTRGPGYVDEARAPTGLENRVRRALIANRRNTTHTCRSVDNCENKHCGPAVFSESNISAKRRDKQYARSEKKSELRVNPYSRGRCKSSDSIRTNHAIDRGGDRVAMRYRTDVANRDKLFKSSTSRESKPRGSTPGTVPRSVEEEQYFNRNNSECTKKQIS